MIRKVGIDMHTLLCLEWMANGDLLCSTGNSGQCQEASWMEGEFGREWIHVHIWLGYYAMHLKLSQHF